MASKKNYFSEINHLSYLIVLLPVFLISGPFLTDLAISILAIKLRTRCYISHTSASDSG